MRRAPAAALMLLAGCGADPEPAPSPAPSASAAPAPVPMPAIDERAQPRPAPGGVAAAVLPAPELDGAVAPGGWTRKASASGAAALFGGAETPRFAIRCDPAARTIAFALRTTGGMRMRIVTANGSASFDARPEAEQGGIVAEAPAQYTFVTQTLARAEGGFAVAVEGGETLRMPWSRDVAAVIRSCQPA